MVIWFHNLSIKGKLTAIMLTVSVVLLILISFALVINERIRLKRQLGSDLMALASIMGTNSAAGITFDDTQAVTDVLKSLKAKQNIIMAHVFNVQGERFASYSRQCVEPLNVKERIKTYDEEEQVQFNSKGQIELKVGFSFHQEHGHAYAFEKIIVDGRLIGSIFVMSDIKEFNYRLYWYMGTMFTVMFVSLGIVLILSVRLQQFITAPLYRLLNTMIQVSTEKNYTLRAVKTTHDEIGQLIEGFNNMLGNIETRDLEIRNLNEQLKEENQRMSTELEVTKKLQQMVLPTLEEIKQINGLDIASYMLPADEVGGDYYDILCHQDIVKIAIGDVTGHGLESGVVMLMAQMAVRTLLMSHIQDPEAFLTVLNHALFANIQRMHSDKNLTLTLLDYDRGQLCFTGQHEDILICRKDRRIERINTINLGFMVGLLPDIQRFISHSKAYLEVGEGIVLYTDGITEAQNAQGELYGVERLCQTVSDFWEQRAIDIQQKVIDHVQQFVGGQKLLDDITLLVIKRVT